MNNKYLAERILFLEYLKKNNYKLYSSNQSSITQYYWIHKDYKIQGYDYREEYASTRFSSSSRINLIGEGEFSGKEIKRKFLIENWNSNSFKDKSYFNKIDYLITGYNKNKIVDLIDVLPATAEEKVKLMGNLPISVFTADSVDFDRIKNIVDQSDYDQQEKDKFYLKFFKSRKNQLKGNTGEYAEKFLMKMYEGKEEPLKPYFDFFSNVKHQFREIELNIEEPGHVIFSQRLNVRKAAKILKGMSESGVQKWIEKFSMYMAKNYQFLGRLEEIDKSNAIVEIRWYSRDKESVIPSQVTIENYNKKLKEFLIHYSKLDEKPEIDLNYVQKWLLKSELIEKLTPQEEENKIKIKSKKI